MKAVVIPVATAPAAPAVSAGVDAGWRWRLLLLAPHRLGFFLGMVVLAAAGLWWAAVQLGRLGWLPPIGFAVSPSLLHAAVMVFGFIPLYFSGFLFTAGPRWLGVEGPATRDVAPMLVVQAVGWLAWLAGGHLHETLARAGLLLAGGGLAAVTFTFSRLLRASDAPDRMHATCICIALAFGSLCLLALPVALWLDAGEAQRGLVLGGLWGFVVVVYVTVAHRMIPFFTSSAVPMVQAWRPSWVLWLMLGVAVFEAAAAWTDAFGFALPNWMLLRGAVELAAGATVLWLALAWGLVQSLRVRLLGMLHLGFSWLGLGLVLGGVSHLLQGLLGEPVLPLAALHAVTMGSLGSLLLAMVTRVSCGHSGRPLVADGFIWSLFLCLQAATVLRIAATAAGGWTQAVLAAAALLWAGAMLAWAARLGNWYGRPRHDGRPG